MSIEHPTPPPSIEPNALNSLASELNAWRAQRVSRRAPIPEALRQNAQKLGHALLKDDLGVIPQYKQYKQRNAQGHAPPKGDSGATP